MKPDPKVALLVRLEAKPGKEVELEQFLKTGLSIAQEEPGTATDPDLDNQPDDILF
jgi:hypothetical protein